VSDESHIYEKLGLLYLGKEYDIKSRQLLDGHVLYDSKDLVTHAVCVGMTGSGKTGLGITLLEEAAIDGIPSLIIDPKGDLTNLLLTFPELTPADFLPWVHSDDARRQDMTPEAFAAGQAELWRKGLDSWGQPLQRIQALRAATDITIFTPGSDSGVPVSILSSFEAPPAGLMEDTDLFRDRVATTATSLLSLLGIDADPIRSREHILITTILDDCWRKGMQLDLGSLIRMLQNPPVQRIGVMDLEAFFPSKERFGLAMAMNNLLAAPGFSTWMTGEPMDVNRLLYTQEGKPRTSIFYIAHLSEAERQFFTALLLNQTLGWMRSRPGTTSLRALLYIDEIFGYMPPVAEPPTKKPLLTLLKQARAYGLGVVLATQNPVDLDYKGLSNTGTWFLGRLQTERDKERVLDGLEGASVAAGGGFDRGRVSEILSGLGKRVFLMHNVHEDSPVVFQTRWALSYLAGPLTRSQIKTLMDPTKKALAGPEMAASIPHTVDRSMDEPTGYDTAKMERSASTRSPSASPVVAAMSDRPVLPPEIPQVFLPIHRLAPAGTDIQYIPYLLGIARMHYADTRKGLATHENLLLLTDLQQTAFGVAWTGAEELELSPDALASQPEQSCTFRDLPPEAGTTKNYATWAKGLAEHLYRTRRYRLFRCPELDEVSQPGEDEREFRIRLSERAREERDMRCEALRDKYASRLQTLEDRVRRAEAKLEREKQEASSAKMQSMISLGATVLSAVLGRKRISSTTIGRASSAASRAGYASRQDKDVDRAEGDLETYRERLSELELELKEELEAIEQKLDVFGIEIEELELKPRRLDVDVRQVFLAWVPHARSSAGSPLRLL
jgi:hypothetical protein